MSGATERVHRPEAFGKYVLLERLAAGGMGEVWLARAGTHGFEKFFAVKRILSQHAETPEFVQMLMNEARVSMALVHPNIAQVFEFGQIDGHFFMALEYVEGLSLNAILRRGPDRRMLMRAQDAVWVALQVCRALQYAHNKHDTEGNNLKIVHRDISPHNILVDESGSVKLIDFGIAKAAQSQVQTEASTIKGKIPYMSPEQAQGAPIDLRSDLYSLGIVLYECLTFERMHPAGNTFEALEEVRIGKIPDLDQKLYGKVPDTLLGILRRCLEANADKRYQTAAQMETDLSRVLHEIEPGHTSYALADLVLKLDSDRGERKERLKSYARISPEELLRRAQPPPLPVDVTLGSFGAKSEAPTVKAKSEPSVEKALEKSAQQFEQGFAAPPPTSPTIGPMPTPSRAPWVTAGAAVIVAVAALVVVLRDDQPAPVPAPPPPPVVVAPAQPPPAPPVAAPPIAPPPPAPPPATTTKPTEKKREKREKRDKKDPVVSPAPAGGGCVAVNAVPWAHVSENGKRLGTTPMPCLELSAGKHTLVLENPAVGQQKTVSVVVVPGETARVFHRFE